MDYRGHKIKIWSVVEAGFILLLFLSLPLTGQTQNDNEIIRVGTDLVSVPFSVYGRDGKYVTGLRSEEIRLFENGVEQTIRFFQPTEEPITVMLLVDVSASMITHMPEMGKAMDLFIDNLRPNDTIVVAYFAAEPQIDIRIPPTKKSAYKYSKPSNPPRTGRSRGSLPTLTFDAVHEAIKYMNAFKGRRAVVLFGDSDLSGFNATAKSNLRNAEESSSVFYTIRYGEYPGACVETLTDTITLNDGGGSESLIPSDGIRRNSKCRYREKEIPKLIKDVNAYMFGLAEKTGGTAYKISEMSDLAGIFSKIIAEIGQQYTLGYYPTVDGKDGERRRITVKVNVPNVAVRSRNEVIYKKSKK